MVGGRSRRLRVQIPPLAYPFAALTGAALGTAWDRMHAIAGTLAYSGTTHAQPWWVPVEFAIAGVAVLIGVRTFGDPVPGPREPRRALFEVVWLSALYALTALSWRSSAATTAILLVLLLFRLRALQRDGRQNVVPALALVAGGPALEAALSASGVFAYARPDFVRIPLWLPVLYMHAVPLIVHGTAAVLWMTRRKKTEGGQQPAFLPNGVS